jgi:glycosyltransferase involved in cell wall biosynthesis
VRSVHVVVPEGIDDIARPSGGNTYDRRVCTGLADLGWTVHEHHAPGPWPWAEPESLTILAKHLRSLPDAAVVLVDGLIASAAPDILVPAAGRLRLVVLVHMPLGQLPEPDGRRAMPGERAVLAAASAVISTSDWTRQWLLDSYHLRPQHISAVLPGVDPAPLVEGTASGYRLLCVAAVLPQKGQDILVEALSQLGTLAWQCTLAGTTERDPSFVSEIRALLHKRSLASRVALTGALEPHSLDHAYANADLLILPSRAETFGMVVTEALAHGLPVIASDVGGVAEAMGRTAAGPRPGLLVPDGDADALALALRSWLTSASVRHDLRAAARARRTDLAHWTSTVEGVARALRAVAP